MIVYIVRLKLWPVNLVFKILSWLNGRMVIYLKVSCSAVAKSKNGSGQIGWVVNFDILGGSVVIVVVVLVSVVVGFGFEVVVLVVVVVVDVVLAVVVVFVEVVEVVFFVDVDSFIGSSSILKKSKSSKNGMASSVVEDKLDKVVDSDEDDDSFVVVEFISWSIAYHVKS